MRSAGAVKRVPSPLPCRQPHLSKRQSVPQLLAPRRLQADAAPADTGDTSRQAVQEQQPWQPPVIRRLSTWNPATPLLGCLDGEAGITSKRLWSIVKRFFVTAAGVLADTSPALAEKLQLASPHWMRHTHATHALQRGADLPIVRDNLRHASLSTTSMYLHSDDLRRAKQIGGAFEAPSP